MNFMKKSVSISPPPHQHKYDSASLYIGLYQCEIYHIYLDLQLEIKNLPHSLGDYCYRGRACIRILEQSEILTKCQKADVKETLTGKRQLMRNT